MTHASTLHEGYMAGLMGENPDESANYSGGEYEEGWLRGYEDRRAGVTAPKYLGPVDPNTCPVKRGMTVTIPKGVSVRSTCAPTKPAGRTYKVVVHDVTGGIPAVGYPFYREFSAPTRPEICWVGAGGAWLYADLNDIPEAQ